MTKYQARVEMPTQFKEFAQAVTAVAGFAKFAIENDDFVIEFESEDDDQYELARTVVELKQELYAVGMYIDIPRPYPMLGDS